MNLSVEVFCDAGYLANSYLIYNSEVCILIDPANNIKTLKKFIGDKKLVGVFLTHGHYDHFIRLFDIIKEFDCNVYMHKNAYKKILDNNLSCATLFGCYDKFELDQNKISFIDEGCVLGFGDTKIKVLYHPGHTNCSLSYKIDNMLFCGDVLFPMSVGRSDLPTGNVIALNDTLARIKKMKHNLLVYPGHDEMFVLSDALKYNPYLK
ncbi:MAG: MBL fold metallo-hydrolase [Erysipelotrichaceae bacterium]|nr:MBL fold metallo-hydrolase [Erysipelotrichaceae bacterium]